MNITNTCGTCKFKGKSFDELPRYFLCERTSDTKMEIYCAEDSFCCSERKDKKETFAVFEIIGEEVEQITVWLEFSKAQKYLYDWRKRYPSCHYLLFEKLDF